MNKNLLPIFSLLLLNACASSGDGQGLVDQANPIYQSDVELCKNESYSKGISVSGEIIKDSTRLEALEDEYNSWLKNEYMSALVKGKRLAVPEQYKGLDSSLGERKTCLLKKGWGK
jgi:hypothetical protein